MYVVYFLIDCSYSLDPPDMTMASVRAELATEDANSAISSAIGITKSELIRRGISLEERLYVLPILVYSKLHWADAAHADETSKGLQLRPRTRSAPPSRRYQSASSLRS
jgi:hypothetical protein